MFLITNIVSQGRSLLPLGPKAGLDSSRKQRLIIRTVGITVAFKGK